MVESPTWAYKNNQFLGGRDADNDLTGVRHSTRDAAELELLCMEQKNMKLRANFLHLFSFGALGLTAALASPSVALADEFFCAPVEIFENSVNNTVTVECGTAVNGAKYLAISAADAGRASRFIALATSAKLSGGVFHAWTEDTNKPAGCAAGCTKPTQYGLGR